MPLKPYGNTLPSFLETVSVLSSVSRCGHSNLDFHVPGIRRFWRECTLDSIRAHHTGDLGDDEMSVLLDAHTLVELASVTENNVSNVSILNFGGHTLRGLCPCNGIELLNPSGGGYLDGKLCIPDDAGESIRPYVYVVHLSYMWLKWL
jgi:hypothetical protein